MATIGNSPSPVVAKNFTFTDELKELNAQVNGTGGRVNIQFAAMKLSMLMINATQDRLATQIKDSTGNLNKLTAMNQLKEDSTNLKGVRSNAGKKETDTMETFSADTKSFADKALKSGVSLSADEYKNWQAGKVTAADIDTLEARIKTQQDSASNQSQADNMNMQKFNSLISQFTNMGMTMLDEYKKNTDRVFR